MFAGGRMVLTRRAGGVHEVVFLDRFVDCEDAPGTRVLTEAPRVHPAHVDLGLTVHHPLGEVFAGAGALGDTDRRTRAMPIVAQAGGRTHQVAGVGRVGDRAGHDLLDAALRPRRHAVEGIHEAVGDDIHVGRGQVEVEVPVDAVDAIGLRAGGLVRADEDAVDLAAVVRRRAGVAGDGDLPIERLHRIERLGDEVLMDHGDDRDVESHHGTDLRGVVAGGIDHVLAHDAALLGDDFPSTVGQCVHVGDAVVPDDLRTQLASTLRQGIGGTGGVGPAVVRRPQRGLDVVDVLHERIELANFVSADDLVLDTEPIQLGADLTVPEHVLVGDSEPQGAAAVPARRQSGLRFDRRVERDGLLVDLGHVEIADEVRHEAGSMPGRARGEFALLDQDRIGAPALVGEVVEQADTHGAAADDHDARVIPHDDSPGSMVPTPSTS